MELNRSVHQYMCRPLASDDEMCNFFETGMWNFTNFMKFGVLRGLIAPKPYVPHQNSLTKGTSLGCQLGPETIPIARNCVLWAVALSQTRLSKVPIFSCCWEVWNSWCRNWKIFHQCMHTHTDSRLLFQKRSKSVVETPCCIDAKKQNTFWHP